MKPSSSYSSITNGKRHLEEQLLGAISQSLAYYYSLLAQPSYCAHTCMCTCGPACGCCHAATQVSTVQKVLCTCQIYIHVSKSIDEDVKKRLMLHIARNSRITDYVRVEYPKGPIRNFCFAYMNREAATRLVMGKVATVDKIDVTFES